jgi:homoaconitase
VDLPSSIAANKEIFDFLQSAAERYGIAFWKPGSGTLSPLP